MHPFIMPIYTFSSSCSYSLQDSSCLPFAVVTPSHILPSVVGFYALSYIAFSPIPLFFHYCPYHMPLTPIFRFSSQIILLFFLSVLYHGAKQLHDRCGAVGERIVRSFWDLKKRTTGSLSENIVSRLPKHLRQRRTRASLMALFYIPGAIRDVFVPYAAGER
ncbi:hypothetical protein EDB87DRAFT_1360872 [Lactarius vividus]|nr:hypothetical protein EDB87DRAFT_1360872 [Lactarius vividus]